MKRWLLTQLMLFAAGCGCGLVFASLGYRIDVPTVVLAVCVSLVAAAIREAME